MPTPVSLPKLGVAMAEGTLVEWLVSDGEAVAAGQPLYRLETDKVENEIEAPAAGVVTLVAEAGGMYPVGTLLAEIS